MNIEEYRNYCIAKPGVTESFPFDETTLVFKVMNKMFALTGIELFASVNLKCDPEKAIELREEYEGIKPGFHMSKKHWNTVTIESDVDTELLFSLIDHSYELVVSKLTKKQKEELSLLQ
jgi:predicted DNA-binding protein (MmcQ/YjbR family)